MSIWSKIISSIIFCFIFLLPLHAFLVNSINALILHNEQRAPFWLSGWKEIVLVGFFIIGFVFIVKNYKKILPKIDSIDIAILLFSLGLIISGMSNSPSWFQFFLGIKYDLFFLWIFLLFRHVIPLVIENSTSILYSAIISSAIVVIGFGILQFFLPHDFLVSFGYFADPSVDTTLKPSSYCQLLENTQQCRAQSFLAGPIRLGSFLLLVIGILYIAKIPTLHVFRYCMVSAAIVLLVFTLSRAAWIGAFLFFMTLLLQRYTFSIRHWTWMLLGGLIIVLGIGIGSQSIHNIIIRSGSSSERWQGMIESLSIMFQNPWGIGLGNSGPASLYLEESKHLLSENWYLQIFTEGGILLGMLFIALCGMVWHALYKKNPTLSFLFFSLMIMACFTHVWEESSVAYSVWAIIGASLAGQAYYFNKK